MQEDEQNQFEITKNQTDVKLLENKIDGSEIQDKQNINQLENQEQLQEEKIHQINIENFSKRQSIFLEQSYQIPESDIFCIRFAPDDSLIATGNYDGEIQIYDVRRDRILHILETSPVEKTPITCFRWRPNRDFNAKKVLLAANSDGSVSQWLIINFRHSQSGKLLFKFFEQDNQVLALDYSYNGRNFITAGKDFKIRLYDEYTKQLISKMESNTWNSIGHSNRIFSLKYYDDNTLISGGWDSNIFIWDTRTQKSVGNIYGPSISGDSVDVKDNIIMTGQYRNQEQKYYQRQLQFWDLRTLQIMEKKSFENQNIYVYSAQYSKYGSSIAIGSSGTNTVQILNKQLEIIAKCDNLTKGCYSLDFANNSDKVVFYGGENRCFIISV